MLPQLMPSIITLFNINHIVYTDQSEISVVLYNKKKWRFGIVKVHGLKSNITCLYSQLSILYFKYSENK